MQRKQSFHQAISPNREGARIAGFAGSCFLFHFSKTIGWKSFLPVFVILISCSAARQVPAGEPSAARSAKPKILFLVFDLEEDSLQKKTTIVLRSKVVSEGKIKQLPKSEEIFPNYLTIEYFEEDKLISKSNIEHPLYKQVEYFDGKEMISKSIKLIKSDFFIRLQTSMDSGTIVIYETKEQNPRTKLQTIKL